MKKIVQILLMLILCHVACAEPVGREQAEQAAYEFVNKKSKPFSSKKLFAVVNRKLLKSVSSAQVGYYAFNIGQDEGFVIVSADNRTPAILGYSDNGSFDLENMPQDLRWWLAEYERQISLLDKTEAATVEGIHRAVISPLIESKWDQGDPYYNQCPLDPSTGLRCYTGCAATAIAQIVNYHQYPAKTLATIPAYTTSTRKIEMQAISPTNIDWGNMQNEYGENSTSQQKTAVANLMKLCGCALEMDYTSDGSGVSGAACPQALYHYFGYDSGMRYLQKTDYRAEEWNDIIYAELQAKRPVLFLGYSTGGGHAFIIDGYEEGEFFHVNWGWGGRCDGFFQLSILNPNDNTGSGASSSTDGYSIGQSVVVGIQPNVSTPYTAEMLTTDYLGVESNYIDSEWKRSNGMFAPSIYYAYKNNSMSSQTMETGIGIFDNTGDLVAYQNMGTITLEALAVQYNPAQTITFGKTLPNGQYFIKGISRKPGNNSWKLNTGSDTWSIPAIIKDDVLTLYTPFYGLDVETFESTTPNPTTGSPVTMKASISNHGTFFNEELYLCVNNTVVTGISFEIEMGETKEFEISYLPNQVGKNHVELVYSNKRTLASCDVQVEAQPEMILNFDVSIDGLNNKGILGNETAQVSMHIANNSTQTYSKAIFGFVYQFDAEEKAYLLTDYSSITLNLSSGSSTIVTMTFAGLEDGGKYIFIPAYYKTSDGLYRDNNAEIWFNVSVQVEEDAQDMTDKLQNPDFESGDTGWIIEKESGGNVRYGGTLSNRCFEAWNNAGFDIYQELTDLPEGVYEIKVQGFYRYQRDNDAWAAYNNADGHINVPTYIYLNNSATPFKNVFDEPVAIGKVYNGATYITPDATTWFPNDMATSAQAFNEGMYTQSAYGLVMESSDVVRIGVKGRTDQAEDSWAIWDNFQLIYHGFSSSIIEPVLGKAITTANDALSQMMGHSEYSDLVVAIELAEEAYNGTDGDEMYKSLSYLYETLDGAQQSIATFATLGKALENLKWDYTHYDVATQETIEEAQRLYHTISATAYDHRYFESEIEDVLQQIEQARWKVRMPYNMNEATPEKPIECTSLLNSPSFEKDGKNTMDGWFGFYYASFGNDMFQQAALAIEFYQSTFDIQQGIDDIPNGYYRVTTSGFYRYGPAENDYASYLANEEQNHVVLYGLTDAETVSVPIKYISAGAQSKKLSHGQENSPAANVFVPNDMVSGVYYFGLGLYKNELVIHVDDNRLWLGASKTDTVYDDWVMLDDFRLHYLGTQMPNPVGISNMKTDKVLHSEYFTLDGRKTDAGHKGLRIVRQTMSDGTILVEKQFVR